MALPIFQTVLKGIRIITAVGHPDGAPPYQVRWLDTGRTTLIFPGAEARIEHPAEAARTS